MEQFILKTKKFYRDESGATVIEYGLISALIGLGIITGATQLGGAVNTKFHNIGGAFGSAPTSAPMNGGGGSNAS